MAPSTAIAQGAGMVALENTDDLAACLARSAETPVLIFKHSTRCPVSSAAMREMSDFVARTEAEVPVYLNLVVESRAVSNEIANVLGVRHESPQLLLVRNGEATWHTSHGGIRAAAVSAAVAGPA